ncbi:MAG: ankyrin repeat domain-containing protein [archaeon]
MNNILHQAINNDKNVMIDKLITGGYNVNQLDVDGNLPIHIACKKGNLDLVRSLLESGSICSIKNNIGLYPLHLATMSGNKELVLELLSWGASPNPINYDQLTPIYYAVVLGYNDIVSIFCKIKEVNLNIKDKKNNTLLHIACIQGYDEIVQTLISKNVMSNILNNENKTPYDIALEKEFNKIIKILNRK